MNSLTLPHIPTDLTGSAASLLYKSLKDCGQFFHDLSKAQTNFRFALGCILREIQTRRLFASERFGKYESWTDFMDKGFHEITGLRPRVGYEALKLAHSKILQEMAAEDREKIPVTNAQTLARIEAAAPARVTPEVVEEAKTTESGEFKRRMGVSKGYRVEAWVADKQAGQQVQRIVEVMAGLSRDAAELFADFLTSSDLIKRAGEGPDNRVDCIVSTMLQVFMNESDEEQNARELERVRTMREAAKAAGMPF